MLEDVAPAVPVLYSIALALATPIRLPLAEPLVEVTSSYNCIFLNASASPLINVISGEP